MWNRVRVIFVLGFGILCTAVVARAADRNDPAWLLPMPEVDADPKVPTLKQSIGHGWAQEISSHAEIERYLRALSAAAGRPHAADPLRRDDREARALLLVITSAKNVERLEEIREANLKLADPRRMTPEQPGRSSDRRRRSSGWDMECTATRFPRATRHC